MALKTKIIIVSLLYSSLVFAAAKKSVRWAMDAQDPNIASSAAPIIVARAAVVGAASQHSDPSNPINWAEPIIKDELALNNTLPASKTSEFSKDAILALKYLARVGFAMTSGAPLVIAIREAARAVEILPQATVSTLASVAPVAIGEADPDIVKFMESAQKPSRLDHQTQAIKEGRKKQDKSLNTEIICQKISRAQIDIKEWRDRRDEYNNRASFEYKELGALNTEALRAKRQEQARNALVMQAKQKEEQEKLLQQQQAQAEQERLLQQQQTQLEKMVAAVHRKFSKTRPKVSSGQHGSWREPEKCNANGTVKSDAPINW